MINQEKKLESAHNFTIQRYGCYITMYFLNCSFLKGDYTVHGFVTAVVADRP